MLMRGIWLTGLSILFIMLWSSGWTTSHFVVTGSNTLSVLTARYLVMFVVLLVLVTLLGHWQRLDRQAVMTHLLIGALCHGFYLFGSISAFELGATAATVAFINSLQTVVTASCAGCVTGELTQPRQRNGLLLGLLSAALIVSKSYQSGVSVLALTLPFIAMVSLAAGTMLNRRQELKSALADKRYTPISLLVLIHTAGALLVFVPLATFNGQLQWQFSTSEWQAILWLAVVVSICSYAALQLLVRQLSAIQVSSLSFLVPPVTLLQGYYLFDEALSTADMTALCLAIGAVYLVATSNEKTPEHAYVPLNGSRLARHRLNQLKLKPANIDIVL